ncbi:hypothetical protein XELAEV_18026162mg [Xenopus laevis]|uniref:Uncharacterized protein n=1 Tax=Xenopus laevis TaxID=8355 RepID=A0A974CV45_XENLA|nr:hypothetical protein XELAEV_18026162mg [Xenopus laevis]
MLYIIQPSPFISSLSSNSKVTSDTSMTRPRSSMDKNIRNALIPPKGTNPKIREPFGLSLLFQLSKLIFYYTHSHNLFWKGSFVSSFLFVQNKHPLN